MIPYDILADWYDDLMGDVPYDQWTQRILDILQQGDVMPKRVLELGCGTGQITGRLLDQGLWVTAVDRSEAMLQAAREQLEHHGGRLRLIASDMMDFNTVERFDAVISVCDGFNYLPTVEALEAMLDKCRTLCRPGGLILFDLSTDWKFTHQLMDTVIAENHEDMAYIWENRYDPESRLLDFELTFFIRQGALFRREMEQHRQRAHSPQEVQTLCNKLDITLVGVFDGYTSQPARPDSERLHCIIINGGKS